MYNALKPVLFASLITLFTVSTYSSEIAPPTDLKKVLREEIRKCPTLDCASSRVQLAPLPANEFATMSKADRAAIRLKMLELARDLWPDTILEGPYRVKFNIRLEREDIQLLFVDGQKVGFRIGYSDKAWDMDHCSPMTSAESKQDLNECDSGRIFDHGFVTTDLTVAFRDESSFSHFEAESK